MPDLLIDDAEVLAAIKAAAANGVPDALEKALLKVLLQVEGDSKRNCPVHDDGILRASITHDIEKQEDGLDGFVGSNVEYAPYVHQGTGLYAIEGHGRKEVPWSYQTADGAWHTTSGNHPQPFIADAIRDNQSSIISYFEGVLGNDAE